MSNPSLLVTNHVLQKGCVLFVSVDALTESSDRVPATNAQIASMVSVSGRTEGPVVKNVMTLGSCAPIVGAEVMSFKE